MSRGERNFLADQLFDGHQIPAFVGGAERNRKTFGAGSANPDERVGIRVDAYDQIPAGRVGLVVDSSGLLSLAVARGSAATELATAIEQGNGTSEGIANAAEANRAFVLGHDLISLPVSSKP